MNNPNKYQRYKTSELVALLDTSTDNLHELEAACAELKQEILAITTEVVARSIDQTVN